MIYILIAVVIILAISEILFMCSFWEVRDKIVELKADQELFASLMKINQDRIKLMEENHARSLELFTKAGEINDILIEQYKTIYEQYEDFKSKFFMILEEYKIIKMDISKLQEEIDALRSITTASIEETYSLQYEQYDDLKKTMLKVGHDILVAMPDCCNVPDDESLKKIIGSVEEDSS